VIDSFSIWSHALAAALFGAIGIWQSQRDIRDHRDMAMVVALAGTAIFALCVAIYGPESISAKLSEHIRNIGWLGFMGMVWRYGHARKASTVGLVYILLMLVTAAQAAIELMPTFNVSPDVQMVKLLTLSLLRMLVSVGALVLLHNLYTAASEPAREALRLPMIGMSIMWVYDLNLATMAYLTREWPQDLLAMRGLALVMIAPAFALATHRAANWRISLSRAVTLQSVSLAAIGGYLVTMVLIVQALNLLGEHARLAQVSFVFASLLAGIILMPSARFRSWLRVKVSKHFFQHRYDYRSEWLRFTETLGQTGAAMTPLDERAIKAVADILESPAGMLLAEGHGGMLVQTCWTWDNVEAPMPCIHRNLSRSLAESGRIIELDHVRAAAQLSGDSDEAMVPQWLLSHPEAWVMIPLVHFDSLIGIVVLARPPISRPLDWEDFDLLRVAGRQVASYLAEAKGQERLADVKQFDEFNRRFAFIMHDIKNMASQLALVVRNAERHADNPEFRADMIETLKSSTARMNALLARLSQHNKGKREAARALLVRDVAERVIAPHKGHHPIIIMGDIDIGVVAEWSRLEQALGHLVQNAVQASPPQEPVAIFARRDQHGTVIDIIDKGPGMSPAFVHSSLFKPFVSTKADGFGVGAFEARTIIDEMGGHLDVKSIEGEGTIFSIHLPGPRSQDERAGTPPHIAQDLAA